MGEPSVDHQRKIINIEGNQEKKRKEKKKRTNSLVDVKVNAVKLAEANEVGADKDLELTALTLPSLAVLGVALMLHPHPELVHLDEIGQHKRDRVVNVALLTERSKKDINHSNNNNKKKMNNEMSHVDLETSGSWFLIIWER